MTTGSAQHNWCGSLKEMGTGARPVNFSTKVSSRDYRPTKKFRFYQPCWLLRPADRRGPCPHDRKFISSPALQESTKTTSANEGKLTKENCRGNLRALQRVCLLTSGKEDPRLCFIACCSCCFSSCFLASSSCSSHPCCPPASNNCPRYACCTHPRCSTCASW